MEEHVQTLMANPETPQDHILVAQARLQRIADHIYGGEWQMSDQYVGCASNVVPPDQRSLFGPRVVPLFVARLVRSKIDIIKAAVPEELLNHGQLSPLSPSTPADLQTASVETSWPSRSSWPAASSPFQ